MGRHWAFPSGNISFVLFSLTIVLISALHVESELNAITHESRTRIENEEEQCKDDHGETTCQNNHIQSTVQATKPKAMTENNFCRSSLQSHSLGPGESLQLQHFYERGITAQAYKADAPLKSRVCDGEYSNHLVAKWPFWRKSYTSVLPIIVKGKVYACDNSNVNFAASTMEVWQPRPNGTYSSIRPGVEDGDCRATIVLSSSSNEQSTSSDVAASLQFETVAPGSTGALGGLIPSSGDYPFYGPGAIHMLLNFEGYHPILAQLSMNDVQNLLLNKGGNRKYGRFHFSGRDMRPHVWKDGSGNDSSNEGRFEVRSAREVSHSRSNTAIEVEVNFYLVPVQYSDDTQSTVRDKESMLQREKATSEDMFCSNSRGYSNSISSFFKDPISICSSWLLDFFPL